MSLSHAISAVSSDAVVRVNLSRNDTDVEVMFRTLPPVRTLAERAGAHLVGRGPARVLPNAEQTARLFSLASQFLKKDKSKLKRVTKFLSIFFNVFKLLFITVSSNGNV